MGRNRKTFTDPFKKEIALEAPKERNTVNEIAAKCGISTSLEIGRKSFGLSPLLIYISNNYLLLGFMYYDLISRSFLKKMVRV